MEARRGSTVPVIFIASFLSPWKSMIKRMWGVTFVDFCYGWTLWVFLTWLPSFFYKSFHLDLKHSALFSSGVLLAGMIGDTVETVERHYSPFVPALRERVRQIMESGKGLESGTKVAHSKVDSAQVIEKKTAGPVSRILSAGLLQRDGHSSGPRIAARL